MRLTSDETEENLFWREQAQTWKRSGFLTEAQRLAFESFVPAEVRRTNIFLRLLVAGFTLVCVAATVGFLFWTLKPPEQQPWISIFLFLCALPPYFLSEWLVRKFRFYRHGMEEGLGLAAVALTGAALGMQLSQWQRGDNTLIAIMASFTAVSLLWLYARFGWMYAALGSVVALAVLPFQFHLTPLNARFLLAAILCGLLFLMMRIDDRTDLAFQKRRNGFLQVVLLLGIYFALNVQLETLTRFPWEQWNGHGISLREKYGSGYWATYIVSWAQPFAVLFAGLKKRKRVFIDAGLVMMGISFATNKNYLCFAHKPWDPLLFGFLLTILATALNRFFSDKTQAARWGITNENRLKPKSHGFDLAAAGVALMAPSVPHSPSNPPPSFGGGSSGGAGASGKF